MRLRRRGRGVGRNRKGKGVALSVIHKPFISSDWLCLDSSKSREIVVLGNICTVGRVAPEETLVNHDNLVAVFVSASSVTL